MSSIAATHTISHLLVVVLFDKALTELHLAVELYLVVLLEVVDGRIALTHVSDELAVAHVASRADVISKNVLGGLVAL